MSHDRSRLLLGLLLLYLFGRGLQPFFGQVPPIVIVLLHVVPPAVFALFHGAALYGWRGMFVFAALCLGVASFFESLSLRTGFPFGHYHFTVLMGPKLFQLPILLALAYLGMGYLSWIVALAILDLRNGPLSGTRLLWAPLLAATIMTAWDFAMDPVWADIDRAWVWHNGGPFFGVPVSNFFGWLLTAYVFYQAFTFYERKEKAPVERPANHWRLSIVFYAASALGNLLVVAPASMQGVFVDATGRAWMIANILWACRIVSLLIMLPFSFVAYARVLKPKPQQAIALDIAAE